MTELQTPLRDHLQDGCGEADLQRVWRKIQHQPASRVSVRSPVRWAMALAACLALCLAAWILVRRPDVAGPLKTAAGADPSTLAASPDAPENVELSDGSRIDLKAESRVEVLENDGRSFRVVLRRGGGMFDVQPGGPRKWTVECAGLAVEVVGTRFAVQRDTSRVLVSVEHGVVVVRGMGIPDGVLRLGAGQSVEVGIEEPAAARAEPSASCAPGPEPAPMASSPSEPRLLAAHAPSGAIRGEDIDQWIRDADHARQAGDPARAAELLRRAITAAPPGDPRRAVASFALAQLELDRNPSKAADTLQSALDAGVPSGMQEDSLARLVQAYARAGQTDKARAAALQYERRFPQGARLAEVRQWALGQP